MPKRTATTKDIALLYQLYTNGQLELAPEFQRNAVWPRAAKAYLIDTILNDRPIPLLFFKRSTSDHTGRQKYLVVDGQQRLRAIFEFLENRFSLTESLRPELAGKRFKELDPIARDMVWQYDLIVEELSGYTDADIKDAFVRMNKYVVSLSPQEIRHAVQEGAFSNFVTEIGNMPFWSAHKVLSKGLVNRFRNVEFAAELAILLDGGPQDKKDSINLYYKKYKDAFPQGPEIRQRLVDYLSWIEEAVPNLNRSRFRKPVDLYAFIGALALLEEEGARTSQLTPNMASSQLSNFEAQIAELQAAQQQVLSEGAAGRVEVPQEAARYLVAASRQTDNLRPRTTRIAIIHNLLRKVYDLV